MSCLYGALDWCCGRGCCLMHNWMNTSSCLHLYEIKLSDLEAEGGPIVYSMHISSRYTCQLSAHILVCELLSVVIWRAVPVSLLQQILLCIPLGTCSLVVQTACMPLWGSSRARVPARMQLNAAYH